MPRLAIDSEYLATRLSQLLDIPSPTGYTDTIVRECCDELRRLGVKFEVTRRGGIRAFIPGKTDKPARAIVSHLDTLGAQVKLVKDNGRLELVSIGNWSARFAEGARVTIFSEKGAFRGTILPLKGVRTHLQRRSRHRAGRLASRRIAHRRDDTVGGGSPSPRHRCRRHRRNRPLARVSRQRLHRFPPSRQQGRRRRDVRGDGRDPQPEGRDDGRYLLRLHHRRGSRQRRRLDPDAGSRLDDHHRQWHDRAWPELRRVRRHHLHGRRDRTLRLSPDQEAVGALPRETTSASRRTSSATTGPTPRPP